MENELLLLQIMAVFTGIAAVALVMQMVFLFRINQTAKQLKERADTFMDRWEPVAETSQKMLEDIRKQSGDILTKINDLAESTKDAMDKADTILGDISTSTKKSLDRVDQSVEGALKRLEETGVSVHRTMMVPVRKARAMAAAMGAIIDTLVAGRSSPVDRATLDEEMFI